MRTMATSNWAKRIALLLLFLSTRSIASPQTPQPADPNPHLEASLSAGMTVWITDTGGRVEKRQIVEVSGNVITTRAGNDVRHVRTSEIARVQVQHSDGLLNGALIGAGAGVATGLLLCTATEPWENCRDDVGPMLRVGAIGAGIGIAIDALLRRRRTIYEAQRSLRLHAAPIVGRSAAGVQVWLSF
jgi:hypothetical protein